MRGRAPLPSTTAARRAAAPPHPHPHADRPRWEFQKGIESDTVASWRNISFTAEKSPASTSCRRSSAVYSDRSGRSTPPLSEKLAWPRACAFRRRLMSTNLNVGCSATAQPSTVMIHWIHFFKSGACSTGTSGQRESSTRAVRVWAGGRRRGRRTRAPSKGRRASAAGKRRTERQQGARGQQQRQPGEQQAQRHAPCLAS